LPAALLAHTLVFGHAHAAAGSFHGLAVGAGSAFGLMGLLFAAIAALRHTRADSPHIVITALTATGWLAALEAAESPHGIPVFLCLLAIAAATALVAAATHACTRTIAAIAWLFGTHAASSASLHVRGTRRAIRNRRTLGDFALFSRPPPALS
jgi:hypothetical protein